MSALVEKIRNAGARLDAELARRRRWREWDAERERLEGSFIDFVEAAWPSIDPSPFMPHWSLDAMAEHLEAVTRGEIKRLLINISPRSGKTSLCSVMWPAWTWARREVTYRSGPQVRFMCASYGHALSLQNSNMTRRLITSPWYQSNWGDQVVLSADQNSKLQFDTTAGGSRISTSVGGSLLGLGGEILLCDDPHSTQDVESEAERENVLRFWSEFSTTRLNNPKESAIVVVMQRLHQEDVSGKIIDGNADGEWTHLCVPMLYEWRRHCVTVLGWNDPRGLDENDEPLVIRDPVEGPIPRDAAAARILDDEREGNLMWPERFGPAEIAKLRTGLGPYMFSGRLQQSPTPAKSLIFRRDWWQVWDKPKYPLFEHVIASLDGAYTTKTDGDFSALTIWGVFSEKVEDSLRNGEWDPVTNTVWHSVSGSSRRRVMLIAAWKKHLAIHGDPSPPRLPSEMPHFGDTDRIKRQRDLAYQQRVSEGWGLVEWCAHSCKRYKVHTLLVEGKGPGLSVAQELQRLYRNDDFTVQLVNPTKDKISRAHSVVPMLANGAIWAPVFDWSEMVINECEIFPKGAHDDVVDSVSQALLYLREAGLLKNEAEQHWDDAAELMPRPNPAPLYRC